MLNIDNILSLLDYVMDIMNREFKRGFKSAFSFTGSNRTRKRVTILSTEDRIRQNWNSVGNDLRKSMDKCDLELKHVKESI